MSIGSLFRSAGTVLLMALGLAKAAAQTGDPAQAFMDKLPEGWTMLDTASGKLNNDAYPDFAIVMQGPAVRTIVVMLGTATGSPTVIATNAALIPLPTDPTLDPFGAVGIADTKLIVECVTWPTMQDPWTTTTDYGFRMKDGALKLVEATVTETHRSTLEESTTRFDLTARRYEMNVTSPEKPDAAQHTAGELGPVKHGTLNELGPQGTWEIIPGVRL